ncbi:OmpA family protein [Flavobacteriales bacterium]|nr:OmpA family protein [Flavobacteriales bacterium]
MRVLLLLLCCSTLLIAQENCNLEVNLASKKNYNKAKRLVEDRRYSESMKYLNKAVAEQADFADAYYLKARIYLIKEKIELAEENLELTITHCPMYSPSVYLSLAEINFEKKQFDKSINYHKTFLQFMGVDEEKKAEARQQIKLATFYQDMYSNPVPYSPSPVKGISTSNDEYLCALSPDNETSYFTRRKVKQTVGMLRPETVEEFTYSTLKDGQFQEGKEMPYPFNMRKNEGGPCLTVDNRELYLTVCANERGYNNCDIYYSYKKYENWSELEKLKYPINKSDSWESQPTISSDGKTLIFSSIRPEGIGGADLYSVTKDEQGNWGEIESLSINTKGNEKSPFLHPDSETLYFSSDTHLGLGGLDIFYCKKDSSGKWSTPKNIGYPINTDKDDLAFFVSADGEKAYFSSNKLSGVGGWDLYEFPLYKKARPEKIMFLRGEVKGEYDEMLFDAVVEVKSIKTNKVQQIKVNQESGQYVGVVTVDDDEDLMVTVKSKDYAFNSQYISSENIYSTPQDFNFKMQSIEEDKAFRINNIYFDSDAYELNEQAKIVLNSFIDFMDFNSTIEVAIHGHTDDVGDQLSNQELSSKRAKKVHDYLINGGVSVDRLSYKGFGESKALVPNDSEENRAVNRRTEFYVVKK